MKMSRGAGAASLAVAVAAALGPAAATASPRLGTLPPGPAAAAWPAVVPGPGVAPGPAARSRVVLLINGVRVLASRSTGARGTAVLLPAGGGNSLIGISLAGKSYLIPPQAMPYLGRGLDLSLFDVAALVGRERAGRLPVTVTYRRGVPRLPGVTLTHTASGAARGYLTQAGAGAFGAALARQFAADHARGSYGQDGMFAGGLSVALAGGGVPTRAAPSRPGFPMRTLTVTGTDLAGRPDTGDLVYVINVDNIGRFSDPDESQNVFYHGSARFSVPAGHYLAIATFYSGTRLTNWHVVARPQFTVSGPATAVHLDARTATSRLQWVTPRPVTQPCPGLVNFLRIPAVGPAFTFSYEVCRNAMWVSPVTSTRLTGALHTVFDVQLTSPPRYRGTPYEYDLAYTAPDGVIPPLRYVVRPATLTTVNARYYQPSASAGGWQPVGLFRFQFQRGGSSISEQGRQVHLPGREIQYYATGRSLLWFASYVQSLRSGAGGQAGSGRVLHPGQRLSVGWNAFPLHPAPNTNLLGAANPSATGLGAGGLTLPSASRAGNTLTLDITPFSDNVVGHTGSGFTAVSPGTLRGRYAVFAGGDRLAGGNAVRAAHGRPDLRAAVRLPPGAQRIRFVLAASRTGRLYRLSPASRTVWTWRSVPAPGATLPPGWTCGNRTRSCSVQPMLTLEYAVAGESLYGSTRAGRQTIHLSVGHLQLVKGVQVTRASVSVSFDRGRTWRPAKLTGNNGSYTATFGAPAGVKVSLRTSAADAAGGSVTEALPDAYQISP
jgi:hypothetical protein